MFQRVINSIFHYSRAEVQEVVYDISLFYSYIKHDKQILDNWYFNNVFSGKYWKYLKNYKWMKQAELDYLHQGILNLTLFRLYLLYEKENDSPLNKQFGDLWKNLLRFKSLTPKTTKLLDYTKRILLIVEDKQNNNIYQNSNSEIYESINWTLKNIIEPIKPSHYYE